MLITFASLVAAALGFFVGRGFAPNGSSQDAPSKAVPAPSVPAGDSDEFRALKALAATREEALVECAAKLEEMAQACSAYAPPSLTGQFSREELEELDRAFETMSTRDQSTIMYAFRDRMNVDLPTYGAFLALPLPKKLGLFRDFINNVWGVYGAQQTSVQVQTKLGVNALLAEKVMAYSGE